MAALNPPARGGEAPVPSRAPQPQITTTPLPKPPGEAPAQAQTQPSQPGQPAQPGAAPAVGDAATGDAAAAGDQPPSELPPPRYVREPGHPVMVILAIPPPPPKPKPVDSRPVIVIDPGHGGVDPGATGLSGVREKTVTLAMAQELQHQLEASGHYRVFLTRTDDNAVPLRERVRIARADHADLFLSIHADVLANRAIAGLSVYTQSETASDREADALAAKENKADLIAGLDLSGEKPEITNILIDLAQRETRNRSGMFAGELVQEMGTVTPLLVNPHRAAGFAVLTAPDVPSVLIELGYLSNREDERGLTSPDHRAQLAAGLVRAIDRFFAAGALLQHS
jgi:N-acetylmuramoyl-L-alanine amidase